MLRHAAIRATHQQLRVFEAVARLGSFTGAAQALHLTQPTVSIQMRELADAVGSPLVEQVGRPLRLTEAGELLLEAVRSIFATWGEFETRVAELAGLRRGRLRIAAVTTAEYFVPGLLGPFHDAYPGIDITLEVHNRDAVVRRLEQDLDDLTVMMLPPEHLPLRSIPFVENPLVVIASRRHRLAGRRRVALAALANEPFLMRERGSGTRMATEQTFADRGFVADVRMELGSNEAIKRAVAAGLGIAVLSRHALDPGDRSLVELPVAGFPIRRQWHFVHRTRQPLPRVARAFLDYVTSGDGARARPSAP
jgi:DNA-binding transcriptional LysR family regulator